MLSDRRPSNERPRCWEQEVLRHSRLQIKQENKIMIRLIKNELSKGVINIKEPWV